VNQVKSKLSDIADCRVIAALNILVCTV